MENTFIKLNDTETFPIDSFSRNTTVQDGKLVSNAYTILKTPTSSEIDALRALALQTIESLKLIHDGTEIYGKSGLDAKITSIDEYLNEDGTIRVSFYIYF